MSATGIRNRRLERRSQTIEELLGLALEIMGEDGVAGLTLGELARRLGVRPPSLYSYFDSKAAIYDALFQRGWELLNSVILRLDDPRPGTDISSYLLEFADTFTRWCIEHPVYAQLMTQRPVPGYAPSPAAYAPAVASVEHGRRVISTCQHLGLLREDVTVDELFGMWTVLLSGVIAQQLANAPQEPFETGWFTGLLPRLVKLYVAQYATP